MPCECAIKSIAGPYFREAFKTESYRYFYNIQNLLKKLYSLIIHLNFFYA